MINGHLTMKRHAIKIVLFLILGAIINVAVSWACVLYYAGSAKRTIGWGAIEHIHDGEPQKWEYQLFDQDQVYYIWWLDRSMGLEGVPTPPRPAWSSPPSFSSEELDRYSSWHCVELGSGWPWISMKCRGGCPGTFSYKPAPSFATNGIKFGEFDWMRVPRILPLQPAWTGFTINTLFCAVILWLLFAFPGLLRRTIRSRRGRCTKCGYDLRGTTHAACPECGMPL